MKLSILIPTLNEPYYIRGLSKLQSILAPQVERFTGQVEIRIHYGGRSIPTGTKRNELIANSEGEYFVQIDSDDVVAPYYVNELMRAIEHGPDVISFIGEMYTNGKNRKAFTIRLGSRYEERRGHYYRWPNHLCCYKRSVVEHVKFPPIWMAEDYQWSVKIQGLLKNEIHINKNMYSYMFDSTKQHYGNSNGIR